MVSVLINYKNIALLLAALRFNRIGFLSLGSSLVPSNSDKGDVIVSSLCLVKQGEIDRGEVANICAALVRRQYCHIRRVGRFALLKCPRQLNTRQHADAMEADTHHIILASNRT